jgi:hypothetical protein
LASFNETFLDEFSDSVVNDIKYLIDAGLQIKWWGLQNEPSSDRTNRTTPCSRPNASTHAASVAAAQLATPSAGANTYGRCDYTQCAYYFAFQACARKIKQLDASIRIHANSNDGQEGASPVANDPQTLALVDAWTCTCPLPLFSILLHLSAFMVFFFVLLTLDTTSATLMQTRCTSSTSHFPPMLGRLTVQTRFLQHHATTGHTVSAGSARTFKDSPYVLTVFERWTLHRLGACVCVYWGGVG